MLSLIGRPVQGRLARLSIPNAVCVLADVYSWIGIRLREKLFTQQVVVEGKVVK